jgi:hypothetical protein
MVWLDGLMNNDIDNPYALKAGCLRIMEKFISGIPRLEGDRLSPYSWDEGQRGCRTFLVRKEDAVLLELSKGTGRPAS